MKTLSATSNTAELFLQAHMALSKPYLVVGTKRLDAFSGRIYVTHFTLFLVAINLLMDQKRAPIGNASCHTDSYRERERDKKYEDKKTFKS